MDFKTFTFNIITLYLFIIIHKKKRKDLEIILVVHATL